MRSSCMTSSSKEKGRETRVVEGNGTAVVGRLDLHRVGKKAPPWFEHGTTRSAIVCSTTEL